MKLLTSIFALLVWLPLLGQGQTQPDSLAIVNLVAQSQAETNKSNGVSLAKEANTKAKKLGLSSQTFASRNLIRAYFTNREDYNGLRTLLELNTLLEKHNRWADVAENFNLLAKYYTGLELYASAVEKHREAEAIAKAHGIPFNIWQNHMNIGALLLEQNKNADAVTEYDAALAQLNQTPNSAREHYIATYRQLAIARNRQGLYVEANNANLEVLKRLDKNSDAEAYATQLNNIGYTYHKMGKFAQGLDYFLKTLAAREAIGHTDNSHVALLSNIGISYQNLRQPAESRQFLQRALNATTDLSTKARINDLLAMAYLTSEEDLQAKEFNQRSMLFARQANNLELEAEAWRTSSIINEHFLAYQKALNDFKMYLQLTDSLQKEQQNRQQDLLQAAYAIERTQGEIQSLIASNQIKDYQIEQLRLENENRQNALKIQEAEAKARLQALELERTRLTNEAQQREVAILKAREENQRLLLEQQRLQESRAMQDLRLAEEQNRVQELQLEQKANQNRNLFIIILLGFVLFILSMYALWRTNRSRKELAASREIIRQERDKSDVLLLNILPESTANELKVTGKATPRKFESATVFFSDFQSFSSLSQNYTPEELIGELELFFGGFDRIITKYGIEKIKTIGDAYMCAAGIPKPMEDHAVRMVQAALEMIEFAKEVHQEQIRRGHKPWHLRVGINTGPVIAGVIGSKKFIYDVWGDTVNLAARLENAGEPDRVNISDGTYALINGDFTTEHRGKIEVKNMGEVDMYFVIGAKTTH
jgi:class 3 adenylate cyclase/tetratricopeptide (TPR) repeat protein